jgi:hypothetical protein
LLWGELPGQDIGDGAVEGDAEASRVCYRCHTRSCVAVAGAVGEDGLAAPTSLLADLR